VTVVLPAPKASPGELVEVEVTEPLLSVAVGSVQKTETAEVPVAKVSVRSVGQLAMTGATLSKITLTEKEHVAWLPDWSVAM